MTPLFISVLLAAVSLECRAQKDNVLQPKGDVTATEGEAVTLGCQYNSTSSNNYLFWYKQDGNNRPTFILSRFKFGSGKTEDEEKFSSTLNSTLSSVPLKIQKLLLSDSAVYYCALRLLGFIGLRFGKPIRLTVTPEGPNGVKPTLFVLSPLLPEGLDRTGPEPGPEVCLATGFRPKGSDMVLDVEGGGRLSVPTGDAVLSPEERTYFYAGFRDQKIRSCELLGSASNNDTGDLCPNIQPTESPNTHEPGSQTEPGSRAELNFYLLVMNAVRVIFTKTLAFNTLLTIRAVLA